jgi:gliding motility-associated-like protein
LDEVDYFITDSIGGGSNPVFDWYLDGILHAANTAEITYDASVIGDHEVRVVMTSDSLCARPNTIGDTVDLYVDPLLTPTIDMPFDDNVRCEDSSVVFNAIVLEPNTTGHLITWLVNGEIKQQSVDELTYETDELAHGDDVRVAIEVDPLAGCYAKHYDTTSSQIVFIDEAPRVGELEIDQEVCFGNGGTVLLTNSFGNVAWSWSEDGVIWTALPEYDNDTSFVFIPSEVGVHPGDSIYTVFITAEVTNTNECLPVNSDMASLTEYPEIDAQIVVDQDCELFELDVTTEINDIYSFHIAWHQSDDGINWNENYSIEPSIFREQFDIVDEYFIAEFSNNICTVQDTVEIVACPDPEIDPANALTPNLDGDNDVWWIKNIEFYPDNKLWIYNRWGNLVYSTTGYDNVNNAWDGTRLGKDMPAAVYYYILDLSNGEDPHKGTITIIR